jgi:DNA polymerase (family 10)
MPVHNSDIADIFSEVADLLDIEGANEFRVRSYREAAQSIENLSSNIADLVDEDKDLTELHGIGESISDKIREIVKTGKLEQLEEIKKRVPEDLIKLLNLSGLGPERVKDLYQNLNIKSLDDLKKATEDKKIRGLEGFGEKTENKIKKELKRLGGKEEKRTKLIKAEEYAEPLVNYLDELKEIDKIIIAGSYRRKKETVGDIDILVTCSDSEPVMDRFVEYDDVEEIISKGDTKSSIRLKIGLQVDLRVVKEKSYGSALLYFTGSKSHNIKLRERAIDRNLKINEYGVFAEGKEKPVAGKTEEEVYDIVDLEWIPPEIRENRGEIEASENGKLPKLISLDDLKGDLHCHTTYTDGVDSIEEMARAAKGLGHQYLAITDHSKRVTVAEGLDAKELAKQIEEIDKINEKLNDFRILKGVEVDILEDGSLDLPDDILKELDIRVCSIHYKLGLSSEKQTRRILKAMENPYFNIWGHPTDREIHKRDPIELNMDKIMSEAAERNVFMEINSSPRRLDLNDIYSKMAKEHGIKIAISTDSHTKDNLKNLKYGVNQARRGWLETDDIINTKSAVEIIKMMKK